MNEFSSSVWAKDGDFGIRPIGSVQEAQMFLEAWPLGQRGPLYYVAANSLRSAGEGSIAPDEARTALVEFLSGTGALAA